MSVTHKIDTYKDILKISTDEHLNNISFFEELVNSKNKYISNIKDCRLDKKNKDIEIIYELTRDKKNKLNNIKDKLKEILLKENIKL